MPNLKFCGCCGMEWLACVCSLGPTDSYAEFCRRVAVGDCEHDEGESVPAFAAEPFPVEV